MKKDDLIKIGQDLDKLIGRIRPLLPEKEKEIIDLYMRGGEFVLALENIACNIEKHRISLSPEDSNLMYGLVKRMNIDLKEWRANWPR